MFSLTRIQRLMLCCLLFFVFFLQETVVFAFEAGLVAELPVLFCQSKESPNKYVMLRDMLEQPEYYDAVRAGERYFIDPQAYDAFKMQCEDIFAKQEQTQTFSHLVGKRNIYIATEMETAGIYLIIEPMADRMLENLVALATVRMEEYAANSDQILTKEEINQRFLESTGVLFEELGAKIQQHHQLNHQRALKDQEDTLFYQKLEIFGRLTILSLIGAGIVYVLRHQFNAAAPV